MKQHAFLLSVLMIGIVTAFTTNNNVAHRPVGNLMKSSNYQRNEKLILPFERIIIIHHLMVDDKDSIDVEVITNDDDDDDNQESYDWIPDRDKARMVREARWKPAAADPPVLTGERWTRMITVNLKTPRIKVENRKGLFTQMKKKN
mmetsp:Transcript_21271/g.26156  ORF Transcript_21271/g.26156 Transcript_21271/m.26156 type:complete len:146 (-) Transcript_21271:533-970(-)